MERSERYRKYKKIFWNVDIDPTDVDAVVKKKQHYAGPYNYRKVLTRLIESLPWFTILDIIPPDQIYHVLDDEFMNSLRTPSLRKKYAFVKKKLSQSL
ncbi:MAG: hypothetical protein KAI81_00300 [Candidatus Marinimicrobia bacterium]|nr:hypothetical protein [Candidatus Neomarinimicrobiota bacterium]